MDSFLISVLVSYYIYTAQTPNRSLSPEPGLQEGTNMSPEPPHPPCQSPVSQAARPDFRASPDNESRAKQLPSGNLHKTRQRTGAPSTGSHGSKSTARNATSVRPRCTCPGQATLTHRNKNQDISRTPGTKGS